MTGSSRGVAAAELALVLPVVFALAMGVVEMGNMFFDWLTLQKAAQHGARFATTGIGDEEGTRLELIRQKTGALLTVLDGATEVGVRSWSAMDTSGPGAINDPGQPCCIVEVSVQYEYHPFTPIISSILPASIPLSGSDRKLNEPWKPCG